MSCYVESCRANSHLFVFNDKINSTPQVMLFIESAISLPNLITQHWVEELDGTAGPRFHFAADLVVTNYPLYLVIFNRDLIRCVPISASEGGKAERGVKVL